MIHTDKTTEDLIQLCVQQGILVPLESLDDRNKILQLLHSGRSPHTVQVVKNYAKQPKKRSVSDFVKYFNTRYKAISGILKNRKELQNATSIGRIVGKTERETVTIIGMVLEKRETKSGYLVFTVEDPTGQIEVWIKADNKQLQEVAKEIVFDEIIGIVGQTSEKRIFASNIVFPDIPHTHELKKGLKDTYVVFVGDVEVGAKLFMKNEFEKFVLWVGGKLGTQEQREIAQKVGYVVFVGDLVHGVGIYPGQEEDSDIHDIKEQYKEFTKYVKMIPEHIQVIMISGNHDAGRLQEPQLPLYRDFAEELYSLPNITILSNPSYITIEKTANHPGFDILIYHGYSLVYYANNLQIIKDAGGMKAMHEVMKLYLKKRHLAPTHGCNTYVPDAEEDPMVIDRVPDFLVTGHVHDIAYANYKGVTVINAGCWNDVSDEQVKRGLEPQPAKLPIVNLRTRELRIMNFYPAKKQEETA